MARGKGNAGKTGVKKVSGRPAAVSRTAKSTAANVPPPGPSLIPNALKAKHDYASKLLAPHPAPITPISTAPKPGVSITVQIPALRRGKPSSSTLTAPRRRRFVRSPIFGLAALILIAGGAWVVLHTARSHVHVAAGNTASAAVRKEPDYQPLLPSAATASTKDYDGRRNLVSYTTTFSDARITVSQQPLPPNFNHDPTALLRAADSINAKEKVDTDKGAIFVATSDIDKSQMGLFASDSVLVFIHSDKTLNPASWKSFVELLQAKSWQQVQ